MSVEPVVFIVDDSDLIAYIYGRESNVFLKCYFVKPVSWEAIVRASI